MPASRIAKELSLFLKSRRARLSPQEHGFTVGRRRAKGLRREEVAQLSGVSVTWYTWLEQGKDIRISHTMVHNLCKALKLDATEREYMTQLVAQIHAREIPKAEHVLSPCLLRTVDAIPYPAFVRNPRWDLLYWNHAAEPFIGRTPGSQPAPNILQLAFTDAKHRATICDWARTAREMIAQLRRDFGRFARYPGLVGLIEELLQHSDTFRQGWELQELQLRESGRRTFLNPYGEGSLTFERACLAVDSDMALRLEVYMPVPEDPPMPRKRV
jgi:transcriptional regulator with XRE-family HTH domain